MQFATYAFIMLALAFNAQASVTPLVLPANTATLYSTQPGPIVFGGYPTVYSLAAAPLALPRIVLGSDGTYVTTTPGSEHVTRPNHWNSVVTSTSEDASGTKGEKTGNPTVPVPVSTVPFVNIPLRPSHWNSVVTSTSEEASGTKGEKTGTPVPVSTAPYAVNIPLPTTSLLIRAPVYAFPREGTYVAKTPGSEHVAPLPGHWNSATSLNLEPAPGTEKAENGLPSVAIHSIASAPYAAPLLITAPLALPSGTHIQDVAGLRVLLK